MNEWYEQAAKKLKEEKKSAKYDRCASVMKDAVCEALDSFCQQDEGFAQAVVQGGTFEDCMKSVAKGCGNGISDLEAYRKAVKFYFPDADIRFTMAVETGVPGRENAAPSKPPERKLLDLTDFL